jgi:putative heme iron utilization protein
MNQPPPPTPPSTEPPPPGIAAGPAGDAATLLLRRAVSGALATALATDGGRPYASLVTLACDADGRPLFLFSDLSDHTRSLRADPRAALLIEEASRRANPQTGPRVTLVGRIDEAEEPRLRRRYLARHPGAAFYAGFADFHIFRMTVERVHFVGGFGRAAWLPPESVLAEPARAAAIALAEEALLAEINADAAGLARLAAALPRRGTGAWRLVALDPLGADFRRGGALARLALPRPAVDAEDLRRLLASAAAGR